MIFSTVAVLSFGATALARALHIRADADTPITKGNGKLLLNGQQWNASGANIFWLGLDQDPVRYPTHARITEVLNTAQILGAKAIRAHTLGVSVGNSLSVWPTRGQTNQNAFDTIDWAVSEARRFGLRLFIPLTDDYDYYHGGKFTFLRWRGITATSGSQVQQFYTNTDVISDFKQYIQVLLTHRNKYTNLTYAEDPTIFAYETGNELGGPNGQDQNVPTSWTSEITSYIKQLAPTKLTIDGTYGINTGALSIASVDIVSDHYYPIDTNKLNSDISKVQSSGKVYFAGELGWQGASNLQQFFSAVEARQSQPTPVIAGDHFWSLYSHDVPSSCTNWVRHQDGYSLYYNDPANSASTTQQIIQIRQHLWKMQGQTVGTTLPAVPCPTA